MERRGTALSQTCLSGPGRLTMRQRVPPFFTTMAGAPRACRVSAVLARELAPGSVCATAELPDMTKAAAAIRLVIVTMRSLEWLSGTNAGPASGFRHFA